MDYLYHKLVIVITRQEPALEFVLLHIINRWHHIDFWAKVRMVYSLTHQHWSCGYMCPSVLAGCLLH